MSYLLINKCSVSVKASDVNWEMMEPDTLPDLSVPDATSQISVSPDEVFTLKCLQLFNYFLVLYYELQYANSKLGLSKDTDG